MCVACCNFRKVDFLLLLCASLAPCLLERLSPSSSICIRKHVDPSFKLAFVGASVF